MGNKITIGSPTTKIFILLVLYVTFIQPILLFGQETQILSTKRSLPDVLPNDEFIYLGAHNGDEVFLDLISPQENPSPMFTPGKKVVKQKNPIAPPSLEVDMYPNSAPTNQPLFYRPLLSSPDKQLHKEPSTTIAADPNSIPPPKGSIPMAPEGKVDPVPPIAKATVPPVEVEHVSEKEEEWVFTLRPTNDQYPSGEEALEKEETQEELFEIASDSDFVVGVESELPELEEESIVVAAQESDSRMGMEEVVKNLSSGQFIQLASYTQLDQARHTKSTLMENTFFNTIEKEVVIYRADDTIYYRVLVGPFSSTEIGVNLVSIRRQGYNDAFRVKS